MAEEENRVMTLYGAGPLAEIDRSIITGKAVAAKKFLGGVIIDVVTPEQAIIAEEAGACAVMVMEKLAADIRALHVVSRMSDPQIIQNIKNSVKIPVFAKTRIGHYAEAQILQQIGADFIDESDVLTAADQDYHMNKHVFKTPFVCGCKNLGEALRRILEGAVIIRTKGGAGTGNVEESVLQLRSIMGDIRKLENMDDDEVLTFSISNFAPYDLVMKTKQIGRLPAILFGAGGIATPADAALMMHLGCDGVIIGSGIFKSGDPVTMARAIVRAAKDFNNPSVLAEVSSGLGEAMVGIIPNNDDVDKKDE